jgi:hypothetical protein
VFNGGLYIPPVIVIPLIVPFTGGVDPPVAISMTIPAVAVEKTHTVFPVPKFPTSFNAVTILPNDKLAV